MTLGAPYHEEDVRAAVNSITRLMEANGLYGAQVTPSTERDDTAQQMFLTFKIQKNKRAKYAMPVIEGDSRLSNATILRATGWRIPVIHWWREVTDSRTHDGVEAY